MKIAIRMRDTGLYRYDINKDNIYEYDYVNMEKKTIDSGRCTLKETYIYYIKKLYENS